MSGARTAGTLRNSMREDPTPTQRKSGFERLRLTGPGAATAAGLAGAKAAGAAPIDVSTSFTTLVGDVGYRSILNGLTFTFSTTTNTGSSAPSFSAFAIGEATLPTTASGGQLTDSIDGFGAVLVNGLAFEQPSGMADFATTADGGFLTTTTPADLGGIATSVDYFMDASTPTVRVFATFTNNNASAETIAVQYGGNLGADADTTVQNTSSGDANFDTAGDRWVVLWDNGADGDPVMTFARFGPGGTAPASTPHVPGAAPNADNFFDLWQFQLAPGETKSLMTFVRFNETTTAAAAGTADFDSLAALQSAQLTAGLSGIQLNQLVNWVPEPGSTWLAGSALVSLALTRQLRRWIDRER